MEQRLDTCRGDNSWQAEAERDDVANNWRAVLALVCDSIQ